MVEMIELCLRQSLKVSSYKSRKLTHLGGRVCGQGLKSMFYRDEWIDKENTDR